MATFASPGDLIDHTTRHAVEEKAHLQRHYGGFDIFCTLLCALIGLDTIGAFARNGPQGFTWFLVLAVLFFVPSAMLTSELGAAFPAEGGPYAWTRLAFGRLAGSITAMLYWATNPLWLGGSLAITAVAAFGTFFTPLRGPMKYAFALLFIWTAIAAVIASSSVGKWLPRVGALTRIVTLGFFALSVVIYGVVNGFNSGLRVSDFAPTYVVFIAVVPLLLFKFIGFEVGSNAGEEMKDPQKDVPAAILRSGVLTFFLYAIPIFGILLVLPKSHLTGLGGFLDAIKSVFTVYGGGVADGGVAFLTGWGAVLGNLAAVAFILALLSSAGAWIGGADRALAAACYDGAGPPSLGRISPRLGTPTRVNVISGIVATVMMVLAFWLTGDNENKYFSAGLGIALSTSVMAYLTVFPSLARLRRTHPDVPRPYRVPGGIRAAKFVSLLTTFWIAVGVTSLIWPGLGVGWFGTAGDPDADLRAFGFGGQRLLFEVTQVVPLLVLIGVAVLFFLRGRATRADEVDVPFAEEFEPVHDEGMRA